MPKIKPYTTTYTLNKELLKKLVKQSGGSIDDISEKIGISRGALVHYMQGFATPGLKSLIQISTYFEVPIDILIGLHTEEEYAELLKGNAEFMAKCKKRAYEDYLIKLKSTAYPDGTKAPNDYIATYPYNLLDCLFQEPWTVYLDEDHLRGLNLAMQVLSPREMTCIHLYFEEGLTLEQCGRELKVTRERIRQIVAKALRKLRHPARMKLILNGVNGAEIQKLIEQEKEIVKRKMALEEKFKEVEQMKYKLQERIFIDKLDSLDLSVRSYNCLLRSNCDTVSSIIELMENGKIFRVRNLGKKSIAEIQEKIGSKYHVEFAPKQDSHGNLLGYNCVSIF